VRASIALPALFPPVLRDGQMLVDGSLVNPVPVSLARAMGAEILIAVDLSSDMLEYYSRLDSEPEARARQGGEWMRKLKNNLGMRTPENATDKPRAPSMLEVVTASLNIMQVRLTRSRMAGDPPDVIITPRLARLGLLDFHRADEAIDEGKRAVEAVLHSLRTLRIQAT